MKRVWFVALVSSLVLVLVAPGALAAINLLENGSFNIDQEPRSNPQGFGPEVLYGWRGFGIVGPYTVVEHAKIVERPDTESGFALRLLGHETEHVGVRSLHMPVEPGTTYIITAKAYIQDLLEPNRFQIFVEWWPAGIGSEATSNRIGTSRVRGSVLREWVEMTNIVTAPEGAYTATLLILIHQEAQLPRLPAEVYVTDVSFSPLE